jgi:hypothetical protein
MPRDPVAVPTNPPKKQKAATPTVSEMTHLYVRAAVATLPPEALTFTRSKRKPLTARIVFGRGTTVPHKFAAIEDALHDQTIPASSPRGKPGFFVSTLRSG